MISSDYTVPDTDLVVRVYRPVGNVDPLPAVYSIHGGGYIIGTYEMMDATFERWCRASRLRRPLGGVPARARDTRIPARSRTATQA